MKDSEEVAAVEIRKAAKGPRIVYRPICLLEKLEVPKEIGAVSDVVWVLQGKTGGGCRSFSH